MTGNKISISTSVDHNFGSPASLNLDLQASDKTFELITKTAAKIGSNIKAVLIYMSDVLSPAIRERHFANIAKVLNNAEKENERRKASGKRPIPLRFAHPALEAIGTEDSDDLLEMWAGLLANAMDADAEDVARRAYIEVLKRLDPPDSHILNWLYQKEKHDKTSINATIKVEEFSAEIKISTKNVEISLYNLMGAGCVTVGLTGSRVNRDTKERLTVGAIGVDCHNSVFYLTTLGFELVQACQKLP